MIPLLFDRLVLPFDLTDMDRIPVMVLSVGGFIVSFLGVFLAGRPAAAALYRRGIRDRVRDYDSFFGKSKSGTPTMGGLLIVAALCAGAMLFCDLRSRMTGMLMLTTLWFGAVGAVDDLLKIRRGSSDGGMSRTVKFALQILFAAVFAALLTTPGSSPFAEELRTSLLLPFPRGWSIDLGLVYPFFAIFAMVAVANAINFADGLDGLATLPSALVAAVFGLFAYMSWNDFTSEAFGSRPSPTSRRSPSTAHARSARASVSCGSTAPTGSQALGGSLAAAALLAKQEILFLIAGGIFVFEAFSVFWQDYVGIRLVGRRFFFRAPAHHGFQHRGVAETKVVLRFWIASLLFAVLSVATLKLR